MSKFVIVTPDAISSHFVKRDFWKALAPFLVSLDLPEAAMIARINRELDAVSTLPNELAVTLDIPGVGKVASSIQDISIVYAASVIGRTISEPEEADYLAELRDWIDRDVDDEAVADGASLVPFFGAKVAAASEPR